MKYMGSKSKIAKFILPIILKDRKDGQVYVEPFVGGCNTIDKVSGVRIAGDNNRYLIALYKALQNGANFPTEIPKDVYDLARRQYYDKEAGEDGVYWGDADIAWVGYVASANGRFFEGGYSGISNTKIGTTRNYISESIRNISKQLPSIQDVQFNHCDYWDLPVPPNSIIYNDPPYKGTKQYATKNFDHDRFWDWCREKKMDGHIVFVSEYNAPPDFTCIWEQEVKSSLSANGVAGGSKTSTERLFKL